jgi:hypothetical protein
MADAGDPEPEAMSREGKGTMGSSDAANSQPLSWTAAADRLSKAGWFWLATVRPDGAPHMMPVMAAWSDPVLYVASNPGARKSRNLGHEDRCVISTDTGDLHIVIEGRARRVDDADEMDRVAQTFSGRGWPTRGAGDLLDADFGAPTSGGPPFLVFGIAPTKAFAFPTDGEWTTPTRWRFS